MMLFRIFFIGSILALGAWPGHAGDLFISLDNRSDSAWRLVPTPPPAGRLMEFKPAIPAPQDLPMLGVLYLAPRTGRTFLVDVPEGHTEVSFSLKPWVPGRFTGQLARIPIVPDAGHGLIAPARFVLTPEGTLGSVMGRDPAAVCTAMPSASPALGDAASPLAVSHPEPPAPPAGAGAGPAAMPAGPPPSRTGRPPVAAACLGQWVRDHRDYPFPTPAERADLSARCGLSAASMDEWLSNARKKAWWPWLEREGSEADLGRHPLLGAAAGAPETDRMTPGGVPAPNAMEPSNRASSAAGCNPKDESQKPRRFPAETVEIWTDWFISHIHDPSPDDSELEALAKATGESKATVRIWFSNKRQREWRAWQDQQTPMEDLVLKLRRRVDKLKARKAAGHP